MSNVTPGSVRPADTDPELKIRRYFTTAGVHPYDEIEWELRDAVIQNYRTGKVAFEQRDVEAPKSWSQNATNIAAQKYFRGSPGTPERERSVKQMIDRVVGRYVDEGLGRGYFDADGGEVFRDELTHLLVTQKAAFNSPVWFNVGWRPKGEEQVAACFILSVEDEMDSILNWYVEEGRIFKHGSGAGINLSKIRSSKERLRSGGTASGPVSFMRGADASAGTIKSGGATRRAAKMVVLNVDHPDVKDFIWCKALEERKARALREAGFDMDIDGIDAHSIQYQNANNSVRVTDDFMQAVVDDRDWELKAITTGEVTDTVKANELFREVAQAAWECADPGLQFDTTINDWHTCPETGRINASNPCSEYLHVDNSACNLASLNLMKFVDENDRFDVDAFMHAVETVFLAQEISVGFAAYPTKAITENSLRMRQLGQGYANLGALLMAQGLPYDSNEGRAWAGAITALQTGHCYATSAKIAKRVGAFDEYAKNREPMLRVIGKHRAAAYLIPDEKAPAELVGAARAAWDRALELGKEYGYRNAQATVLAPTGCLVGGSLVPTERGLVRLRSLGDPAGEQWQDLGIEVNTDEGPRTATKFYVNGPEAVVTVTTDRGYRIQGTPRHRIKVVNGDGAFEWKRFSDLEAGDVVPLALDQLIGEPQEVSLPPLTEAYWTGEHDAVAPRTMSPELAEFIGYFMGDGSLHSRGIRLCVAAADFDVVERLQILGKELFGLQAHVSDKIGYVEIAFHSVRLALWWEACGFSKHRPAEGHAGKGWTPHIPDAILHSNDRETYSAFLRGLFEADGTVTTGYPQWSTTSIEFSHEVQGLLLALGFPTTRKFDVTGWGKSDLAVLRLLNLSYNRRWLDEVGFVSVRKNAAVQMPSGEQSARKDKIPVGRALIDRVAPKNDRLRKVMLLEAGRTGSISRRLATEAYARTRDAELGRLLGYFYDTVRSAGLGDDEFTYDLSVPDNVTYVANGFISHNTIGLLMDCDTTGIEPDLALKKTKKLVGGGTMSIVNQTVPKALRKLGYDDQQIQDIVKFIDENSHVVGAPHLREEHMSVFDTAMGERSIHYMGHIRMMAAAQPFISGAISKCVTGETLLTTADGLIRIGDLHRGEPEDTFRDEFIEVASLDGEQKTDAFYYGGKRQVRRIRLRSGHEIVGTPNHRVLVAVPGGLEWRYLDDIHAGEYVGLRYGSDMWSEIPASLREFRPTPARGSQKEVRIPEEMTEDLALLLGAFASEGNITRSNWTITITDSVESVLVRLQEAWRDVFGVEARITRQEGKCPAVVVSSKTIVEFFEYLGCGIGAARKRIPDVVLRSPRSMVLAFLSGLMLDGYVHNGPAAKVGLCVASKGLLDDYHAVLTNLGVVHGRVDKVDKATGKTYGDVYVTGEHAQRLATLVRFWEPDKMKAAYALRARSFGQSLRDGLHFSPVAMVEDAGERDVYDVSVPTTHAFVGNGIVNHNTVNLPESVTVEDVEQAYIEGWRLGLKALAIYRDNCKAAQPLSVSKKGDDKLAEAMPTDLPTPVRRRLPKKRVSKTIKFRVADTEGYITVGEFPDGGVGEIFLKVAKQGSTLAGIMDAFAISISMGLQYGVPLTAYVKQFVNTRFEPSGMTDDPDFRIATSILDYVFRVLAFEYLPAPERHALGIKASGERQEEIEAKLGSGEDANGHANGGDNGGSEPQGEGVIVLGPVVGEAHSGSQPFCGTCGVQMQPAGSCFACPSCGSTSGCS